ncbi:MAG: ABC transporter substrate-binding protein [Desulfovibrionaceae bacterium]|jgi:NitT/TauT family transport system substrate-binding protein|nr:ABC transporter substrate-binding protein [Desulfovibrionaceae bacterium]
MTAATVLRRASALLALLALATLGTAHDGRAGRDAMRLSGPPVAETLPLIALAMHDGGGDARGVSDKPSPLPTCVFTPWHSPDQLRAMVAGGQVDAALVTVAAASRLAERGVPVRVVAILSSPGWILSAHGPLRSMDDLRGKEILLPFGPGEMPEALFTAVAAGHGLTRARDYALRNGSNAMEVVQHLLLGHADYAFVSEPAATLAVSRSAEGSRPLVRGLDLRAAWAEAFPACPELPATAVVLFGPRAADPGLARDLNAAFRAAAARILADPGPVMAEAAEHFPEFTALPDAWRLLAGTRILDQTGAEEAVRFYLETLRAAAPGLRVGDLPHGAFSHAAPAAQGSPASSPVPSPVP